MAKAKVVLVDQPEEGKEQTGSSGFIGISRPRGFRFRRQRVYPSPEEYARNLFSFFRLCDDAGLKTVFCERVPLSGLGRALMDRLERAADSRSLLPEGGNKARG